LHWPALRRIVRRRSNLVRAPRWLDGAEFLAILLRSRILGRCQVWPVILLVIRPVLLRVGRRLHRPARWLDARHDWLRSLLTIVIGRRLVWPCPLLVIRPVLLRGWRRLHWTARWLDAGHDRLRSLLTIVIVRRLVWPVLLPIIWRSHWLAVGSHRLLPLLAIVHVARRRILVLLRIERALIPLGGTYRVRTRHSSLIAIIGPPILSILGPGKLPFPSAALNGSRHDRASRQLAHGRCGPDRCHHRSCPGPRSDLASLLIDQLRPPN
jgi:hypothetical protein